MKASIKCESVFTITNRGVVVTGELIHGDVSIGDMVVIKDKLVIISGVDNFTRHHTSRYHSDTGLFSEGVFCGILLKGIKKEDCVGIITKTLDVFGKDDLRNDKLNELLK